jgi:hypothetical protein
MISTEWLFEKLWDEPKDKLIWHSILNKAKEMHKQEIIDAWIATDNELQRMAAEEYYNETYGSNRSDENKQFSMDEELCINHSIVIPKLELHQQEISDEEIEKFADEELGTKEHFNEWFEQFKKK